VLDELPRTASGKVQKFKLRQLARESSATTAR
jgi:acyl-coenzyme A synthetase/AMP-(fatty) acid ligase